MYELIQKLGGVNKHQTQRECEMYELIQKWGRMSKQITLKLEGWHELTSPQSHTQPITAHNHIPNEPTITEDNYPSDLEKKSTRINVCKQIKRIINIVLHDIFSLRRDLFFYTKSRSRCTEYAHLTMILPLSNYRYLKMKNHLRGKAPIGLSVLIRWQQRRRENTSAIHWYLLPICFCRMCFILPTLLGGGSCFLAGCSLFVLAGCLYLPYFGGISHT